MPLTLVQGSAAAAWGTTNNAAVATDPVAVTWGAARTVGNVLYLTANSDGTLTTPTGWTLDRSQVNNSGLYLWYRIADNTATDAPSLDNNASTVIAWAEYSGNTASPEDVAISAGNTTNSALAFSTGTTAATAQADELAVAAWGSSTNGAAVTWSAHTNGFTEVAEGITTKGSGVNVGLSVATKALAATGTVEATATPASATTRVALVGTYKAAAGGGAGSILVHPGMQGMSERMDGGVAA